MVGRNTEMETLLGVVGRAFSGQGGLVLIAGEAGVGKTRLCDEFRIHVSRSDCEIMTGRCLPGAPVPYLPFMEAFQKETVNPFSAKSTSDLDTGRLFFAVLNELKSLAEKHLRIMIIDDLQWAEPSTVALLHFLARNIRDVNMVIIGTYRPEDLIPGPEGPNPFRESLSVMRREDLFTEIDLLPLSHDEIGSMVPGILGGAVDDDLRNIVAEESRGNALFAVEVVRLIAERGTIRVVDGVWKFDRQLPIPIPSSIMEVISRRVEHVPTAMRRILETASVIGEWFEADLVKDSIGIDRTVLLDDLEILDKRYNLVREINGDYRFSHQKIGHYIYEQLSPNRRQVIHRSIGSVLEKRLPKEELLGPLSFHFQKGGERDKCIQYSAQAGQSCLRKKAYNESERYLKLVLDMAKEDSRFEEERLQALEGMGDVLYRGYGYIEESQRYYQQFLDLNKDPKSRARVLVKAADIWDQFGLMDMNKANALLDEAETFARNDISLMTMIELERGNLLMNDFRIEEALPHLKKAKSGLAQIQDTESDLLLMHLEIMTLAWTYHLKEAQEMAERRLLVATRYGNPYLTAMALDQLGTIYERRGNVVSSLKTYSESLSISNKLGLADSDLHCRLGQARLLELDGDPSSSMSLAMAMLDKARAFYGPIFLLPLLIHLGMLELECGDTDRAQEYYLEASGLLSAQLERSRQWNEADLSILRALLLEAQGFHQESIVTFEEVIKRSSERGRYLDTVNARLRYALALVKMNRLEDAQEQFDRAAVVAEKIGCMDRVNHLLRMADRLAASE